MIIKEEDYLEHYGIKRKSGRYPWGSGNTEAQRSKDFYAYIQEMKDKGLTPSEIAEGISTDEHPFTTKHLRATTTMASAAKKAADISDVERLKATGMSNVEIGKELGMNESSVRALLAPGARDKIDLLNATSDMLRRHVDEKGVVDVGKGVYNQLEISKEKLTTAVAMLESEGYTSFPVQVDQQGTGQKTTTLVLAKPGITYKDVVKDKSMIKSIDEVSKDGGRTWYGILPPLQVSSNRVGITYKEDGGADADGVMYIRRGVKDLHMGEKSYAQVRINVDGTHYLKGMAIYKDDLPPGIDIQFNTNKSKTTPKMDVLKPLQKDLEGNVDKNNPFGAAIKQLGPLGPDNRPTHLTSAINIVNEEGNWDTWSRSLASQTLSKQSPTLAQQQLRVKYDRKKAEFDEIMALTNPVVKKKLLDKFAESADSSAIHLKAAALPKSSWHVILPVNSLKDHEIYAPNFNNGDRVALIRYPHGGKFEIPELTVNNKHAPAIKLLGRQPKDAVGINAKVAGRLSGADFDGDAVLVIPNNRGSIKTAPALAGLKGFEPQRQYPPYDGMKTIDGGTYNASTKKVEYPEGKGPNPRGKGRQMGDISNLITDMTIKNANSVELAAAVRHSMVVIDSEKHALNWKKSAQDNNIASLKIKYQGRHNAGASTLISKATSPTGGDSAVLQRRKRPAKKGGHIDKATGEKVWEPTGASYVDKRTGKTVFLTTPSVKLREAKDAHTLSSGTRIESVYAEHSNSLKALANAARKESVNLQMPKVNRSAKTEYAAEVKSLNAKLHLALKNAPRERQAQVISGTHVKAIKDANPDIDEAHLKRIKAQTLAEARHRTGARKDPVVFEGREWEAVQAGAISYSKLDGILNNADIEQVKTLATPRAKLKMNNATSARAKSMLAAGYTQAEVADQLGMSVTTLKEGLKDG